MDRREFLMFSAASLGCLAIGGKSHAFTTLASGNNRNYNIVILGDTHFDAEPASIYHSCYDEKTEWIDRAQRSEFARNGEMWRDRCPRLLKRAASPIDGNTKMAFQMGDLIQGDCGDGEVHRKMLNDAMNIFKKELDGIPFVTVAGNHDIRGIGAEAVYNEYMPGRMGKELGKEIDKTTFSFNIGDDAFIFVDFNNPDDLETDRLLEETKGARHTFIVIHGPVFPSDDSNSRWIFHGGESEAATAARRHFRKEFALRNAIVLCGHTHKNEYMDWWGDGGRITQMTMSSVWTRPVQDLSSLVQGPAGYGSLRSKVEKMYDGSPLKDETALFDEYREGLKAYDSIAAAGSYKLNIGQKDITVDFYAGDSSEKSRMFRLR